MEYPDSFRPKSPDITPKKLLRSCQGFADILAGGQWFNSENREVAITRSFTDVIGRQTGVSIVGMPLSEVRMKTEVNFSAEKELIDEREDELLLEEIYQVSAKVRATVEYPELPGHVAELLSEVLEAEADEVDDETYSFDDADAVTFSSIDLEREQELTYTIDDNGEIANYYLAERFFADGEELDEAVYSLMDSIYSAKFEPTALLGRQPLEWQKVHARQLSEEDVGEFLSSFETVMQSLLDAEEFDTMLGEVTPPEDEHRRRAMAIISMASLGFKPLKR